MRARWLMAPAACLALWAMAGCGSFENKRFSEGEGTLVGATDPGADVWIVGRRGLATTAGGKGDFRVAGVPSGNQRLIVSREGRATLSQFLVVANATAQAGIVLPADAASLVGVAPPGALIHVPGTGLVERAGPDGTFRLSGLPVGCFPLRVAGADVGELCVDAAGVTEADLSGIVAPPQGDRCAIDADCPVGAPCEGGSCQAPACFGDHACAEGFLCQGGSCRRDCACGEDADGATCDPGFTCEAGCRCEPIPCDPETLELCNGADDDCDGLVDEDLGLGAACGPPSLCGEGVLECGEDGRLRCSVPADAGEACVGYGPVLALNDLSFSTRGGFDLDDKDGDGDADTGIDNALGGVGALLDLLENEIQRALRIGDGGRDGTYLIELAGLTESGDPIPGAERRVRLYLARERDDGAYEVLWSLLGDDGLPLGDLPAGELTESGVLAGPAGLRLRVGGDEDWRFFSLRRALLGLDQGIRAEAITGRIGGAVDVSNLLGFIQDDRIRDFLSTVLSPGDVDTDGDGLGDAVSLGLEFTARRVRLATD